MKKILVTTLALSTIFLMSHTVHAGMLLGDTDGANLFDNYSEYGYWDGKDANPMYLKNSSEAAEENWLEALNGLRYDDPSISLILKKEFTDDDIKSLSGYNPGFAWEYVVVKAGRMSYAFSDALDDNLFTWQFDKGISHMTFFGDGTVPVPEPATMLLFGTGLLGLAAIGRRRKS